MSTLSTKNRTVAVDALVEWFENAGIVVEPALAEISAVEERENAQRRAELDAVLAEYDAAEALAQSTPCDFEGCTRLGHQGDVPSSDWRHDREHVFSDGPITVEIARSPAGVGSATLMTDRTDPLMTAADLRSMADAYESFPAWLRARANELEAINV